MNEKIGNIKIKLASLLEPEKAQYVEVLREDKREGVKKLVQSYEKTVGKIEREQERVKQLIKFDYSHISENQIVAGVDEVGRGPLAGPVVAACVVIDKKIVIPGINDSKKLSNEKREALYKIIVKESLHCSIGIIENDIIDEINILNATFAAMTSAIKHVSKELAKEQKHIDLILVDGNQKIRELDIKQQTVVSGDSKSYSIACASIVAKVYRDRLMVKYDKKYPGYDFAANKGYGTSSHYQGLNQFGFTPIHRRSFCKNLDIE